MTRLLPSTEHLIDLAQGALAACGAAELSSGGIHVARSPITGATLGGIEAGTNINVNSDVDAAVDRATGAYKVWRITPAPRRAELVRHFADLLRDHITDLATLVTLEAGKIRSEALGEVQEMIDICDFAVGLSRTMGGRTLASERPGHRLMETWHPIGPVGVISAFNFPVAVWSWNAALAVVCGNPVVWKPSELTPLTAVACQALFDRAAERAGAPAHLNQVLVGGAAVGAALAANNGIPVISATGSTAMGAKVGPVVAARFGRSILELGGNNAAIVAASADVELAVRGITFSAAGTAGQRCTTLRRVIVHHNRHDEIVARLAAAYSSLPVGNPLDSPTLVGPLIQLSAYDTMAESLKIAIGDGGRHIVGGERLLADESPHAAYTRPAIVTMPAQTDIVARETFAPLLYVLQYDDLDQAIDLQNGVPQGLASSIFTTDVREAERFCATDGSDCGIANVNIGPSGAEIGGAFGGEKATGGGRESGSDSWKAYMRRATNTVNYSNDLPLAQGVQFG